VRIPSHIALGGALVALSAGCGHLGGMESAAPPPPSAPSRLLGVEAPAFHRPTVQGARFDSAAASGRVMVVDFFAAYCRPCQAALPAVERLHRARPDLAVVGISMDEDPEMALRQVVRHRLTFPVVHDSGSLLAGRFRVTELPAAFVIDRAGRVSWASGPGQPQDALEQAATAAMAGRL
jgi:peroxiredoxin